MAQVLSLKELRTSSVLKEEISKLQDEKAQLLAQLERQKLLEATQHEDLLEQLERQKLLEAKLHEDLLEQKKDFEHLEKQFEHFAGIEAEFEALQQQVQLDRLEQLIGGDKKDAQTQALIKKLRDELKEVQDELRELKQLDPQRLKRQVADLKKKTQQQATDNQSLNTALVAVRKDLKETTADKDKLEAQLKASQNGTDFFWQSVDGVWVLYESSVVLKDETVDAPDKYKRIRVLNTQNGMSTLSQGKDDADKALWLGELAVPADVSEEAGKRLLAIAAALEEDAV